MRNKIIDIAIAILVYIFLSSIPYNYFISDPNLLMLTQTLSKLIALVFSILFLKLSKNLENKKISSNFLVIMLLIPTFVVIFNNQIFISIKHYKIENSIDWLNALVNVCFILATAITEEFIFRKIVLDNLPLKNRLVKVVISAGIFGLFHIITFLSTFNPVDLIQIVYTAGLGMILGFFYEYGKNIIVPIVLHFLYNLMNSYVFSLYIVNEIDLTYYLVAIIDAVIVAGYILLIYLLFIKKYSQLEEKEK